MLAVNSYKKSRPATKKLIGKFIWGLAAGLCSLWLFACGSSDLGRRYSRDPVTAGAFGKAQEDSLSSLLQKYVDANSRVNYQAWRNSSEDRSALKAILTAFGSADIKSMSSQELKSFYINAYNSMTIDLIISHYDETLGGSSSPYPNDRSIRNIQNLDDKVWDGFKWKLSGQDVSLNDLENKLLRPLGDARIHFSIVCASKGCPPLLNRAFSPSSVDQTLEQLATDFVNSGRNTEFRSARHQIKTSHILEWFAADFIHSFGSVNEFFAKYVKTLPPEEVQNYAVTYTPYDWTLNEPDQPSPPQPSPSPTPAPVGSGTEAPPMLFISPSEELPNDNFQSWVDQRP